MFYQDTVHYRQYTFQYVQPTDVKFYRNDLKYTTTRFDKYKYIFNYMPNTTNPFTTHTLQSIYSYFLSDIRNFSTTVPLNTVPITLTNYIGNPDFGGIGSGVPHIVYNGIVAALRAFKTKVNHNSAFGIIENFRITVLMADGNIFYDSWNDNPNIDMNKQNTYENFIEKRIGENHGSRHYVQQAFHSKNGIGSGSKWSSTTRALTAYHAVRLGMNDTGVIGVVVLSHTSTF